LSDVQAITAEARERKAIIADAQKALQNIDAAAVEIAELSRTTKGLVDTDGKRTLAELADAAEELKAATKDARGMITRLEGPTTDFANTGLPQLTRAVTTLQSAAESLDRLVGDIEQNPQGLVSKPPAKEVEVRP
jgi:phospholipid/cholesterol/gamma-HCH transport system substrate-binding protein